MLSLDGIKDVEQFWPVGWNRHKRPVSSLFDPLLTLITVITEESRSIVSERKNKIFSDSDSDGDEAFGSAGGLSTPNISRTRVLAEQRELSLKKRQTSTGKGQPLHLLHIR
jgi:hypothetical protein